MFTPPPALPFIEPPIFVKNTMLRVVDPYLGRTISRDGALDAETSHIQKASVAFGKLERRV